MNQILHFQRVIVESVTNGRKYAGVVSGTQGFPVSVAVEWDDSRGVASKREAQNGRQGTAVEVGQVARDQEIPFRLAGSEGGFESRQRPETRAQVFENRVAERMETVHGPEEGGSAGGGGHFAGDVGREHRTAPGRRCLFAAHPEAPTPGEHVPRRPHATIILSLGYILDTMCFVFKKKGRYNHKNRMLVNCFQLLGLAFLAAPTLPAADAGVTSVVRADARTGRLVRSVVVSPIAVGPRVAQAGTARPPVIASHEVSRDLLQFIDDTATAHEASTRSWCIR